MKAVFVVDMPETCLQCPFTPICSFDKRNAVRIIRGEGTRGRLSECPLKPLPQKQTLAEGLFDEEGRIVMEAYFNGYNACLEEIEE